MTSAQRRAVDSTGVFATPGTGYRLRHPETVGPFLGTVEEP